MLARVLTASANATNVARELMADDKALGALLAMLSSWEEPIRLAAVRALAKITWLVRNRRKCVCTCKGWLAARHQGWNIKGVSSLIQSGIYNNLIGSPHRSSVSTYCML